MKWKFWRHVHTNEKIPHAHYEKLENQEKFRYTPSVEDGTHEEEENSGSGVLGAMVMAEALSGSGMVSTGDSTSSEPATFGGFDGGSGGGGGATGDWSGDSGSSDSGSFDSGSSDSGSFDSGGSSSSE